MKKAILLFIIAILGVLGYKTFRFFFPEDSDRIATSDLLGKWRRIDIDQSPESCHGNHIEYLSDSEMVIVSGPLRVWSKYTLQDQVQGAYAIAKREFRITGDYDCTGTFIDSIKARHFTIGRWVIWKKGNTLRQYIREERDGRFIEFRRVQ